MEKHVGLYILDKCSIRKGSHYENSLAIETITEKVHILIDNGLITSIVPVTTPYCNI